MEGRIDLVSDLLVRDMSNTIKRTFPELNNRFVKLYWEYNTNTYSNIEERRIVLILKNPQDAIYGYSSIKWPLVNCDYSSYDMVFKSTYDDLVKNIADYLKLPYMDKKMRCVI